MNTFSSPLSSPLVSRERASAMLGQHKPGISLCSSALELNGPAALDDYNGKGQILLREDKEEMWKEAREEEERKGETLLSGLGKID